ncbi:hypothetical protein J3R30DRAFT_3234324, partial [Lentinula aciculospora]
GLTVVTHCFSRSVAATRLITGRRSITCARLFMVSVFANSWLFVFINQLLVFGISLEYNDPTCKAAAHLCAVLYGSSKIFMCLFLAEKVHIVWSPDGRCRLSSLPYKICLVSLGLYALPAVALLSSRRFYFPQSDGVCVFSLEHHATNYIVAYDVYVTILFTALFLWPLLKPLRRNPFIRQVAFASIIALTTSTTNGIFFVFLKGHELGWVCVIACSVDVIVNSVVLFWVSHCGPQED